MTPYSHISNPLHVPATTIVGSSSTTSAYQPGATGTYSNYNANQPSLVSSVMPPTSAANIPLSSSVNPQALYSSISPIKVSNIELTRPNKNVFPSDTYVNRTKFDENLIIMTEDDY